ncbi:protein ABHD11 [Drosophila nasuta]|uniref:protein ABHD11 n=1 Tax=Drosophila nasuta TaxID=42062 RepID=UPI00295EBC10|nr:protein ABHD11 [Drosophila nasuta]
MQLFNGTLRCLLQAAHRPGKYAAHLSAAAAATATRAPQQQWQRHYSLSADPAPIAMAYEMFETPNTDTNKPPLMIMHGLFGSKQNWRSVGRAIASKTNRRVFTVDLRNHGDSPHANTHNSAGMTADIKTFLAANGISKVSLMGHSMGGRASMHFSLYNTQLVERLIVVDISPVSMPRTLDEMNSIMLGMQEVVLPSNIPLSEARQRAKQHLLKTVAADSVDFIMLNLRKRPDTGEFHWACNVDVLRSSLNGFLNYGRNIHNKGPFLGPATFICGSHSPYMNPDDWPEVLHFFPNANLHWLETGHLVHLEKPHDFIKLTTDFLNS